MATDVSNISLYRTVIIALICSCTFKRNSAKPATLMVSLTDKNPDPVTKNIENLQKIFDRQHLSREEQLGRSANTTDEIHHGKQKLGENERDPFFALWKAVQKESLSRQFEDSLRNLNSVPLPSNGKNDISRPNGRIVPLPPIFFPVSDSQINDKDGITLSTMATTANSTNGNIEKRGRRKHVLFRLLHPNRNFKFNFGKITIDPIYYFIGLGK